MNNITPINYKNVTVATTQIIADFLGANESNIKMNYSNNKGKFIEGKHFFQLSHEEVKDIYLQNYKGTKGLTLWTERGCARHSKLLQTPEAWDLWEKMEDVYFAQNALEASNQNNVPAIANMQQQMMNMQQQLNDVSSAVRNGVPPGYMSRRTALRTSGKYLSMVMFEMVLEEMKVQKKIYISVGQGYESPTFGWKSEEIEPAITRFLDDAIQVSKTMCSSSLLHGKRFRYTK